MEDAAETRLQNPRRGGEDQGRLRSFADRCDRSVVIIRRAWVFLLLSFCFLSARAEVQVSTATGNKITVDDIDGIAVIEGDAVVHNATATLKADTIRLNNKTKTGVAEGNVVLQESSGTIKGTRAEYNWETATGVIHDAEGESSELWRFEAEKMVQVAPNLYRMSNGDVTTCSANPPHYHIRSSNAKIRRGKRMTLINPRFIADTTPALYFPFYTRSLVPKKYRLSIEPGQTSRDGITTRTIFGYPFTENSYTKLRWDYLQFTGNGVGVTHRYFAPTIKGDFDWYWIRDSNSDPQPQSRRYTVLWNHYQKLTKKLSLNSKIDLKSDQTFGNQFANAGNQVFVENATRGLLSESGLTYQWPRVNMEARVNRQDKFDAKISSKNFISYLSLPQFTFDTIPLTGKKFPLYVSFNGSYINDTMVRTDPKLNLRYKQNATFGTQLKKDVRIKKKWTITPQLGYLQSWQNRIVTATTTITEKDQYVGRYNTGVDVRRRFMRLMDLTVGHRYIVRNRVNQTKIDSEANDHGIEGNQLSGALVTQIRRSTRITLASGYDLRDAPKDSPQTYDSKNERITPPSLDIQYELKKDVNLYFRETYSVFDSRTRTVIHTPVNTSGEIQFGNLLDATMFSQGFTYTKPAPENPSELFLTNRCKFYLTSKWYIDLYLTYRAVGEQKLDYRKLFPVEKTLRVVRDMHCWVMRAEFSKRPDRSEASFYIDLKANLVPQKNVFTQYRDSVYSSTRNDGPDITQIFPQ